jgi:pimeloyl-ACP methyl ester carboxylesterase
MHGNYSVMRSGLLTPSNVAYSIDLYSRGYSVGPSVEHNPQLYVTQLHELLRHVGWKKCNFVGLSLVGGSREPCHLVVQ